MKMALIILLSLWVSATIADYHTLRYYYTGVSGPGSGVPEYSVVGFIDDKKFVSYNSESHSLVSGVQWLEKNLEPEYWEKETQKFKFRKPICKHYVMTAMARYNQTGGFHTAQWTYGCDLNDDGSTSVYSQIGYDGRDVIYLDTKNWLYIPIVYQAQLTTEEWNHPELKQAKIQKNYLENFCISSLRKFIEYGREDLEQRVRPEVKVWGRLQSDGLTRLHCLVYGFHPRAVDVKWVRNEVDQIPLDEMSPILPHPDGTYQIRVSVEVPTTEEATYSCHVDHSSLPNILTVKWEPNKSPLITVIVGAFIGVISVITAGIIGVFLYKKRKGPYRPANSISDADNQKM